VNYSAGENEPAGKVDYQVAEYILTRHAQRRITIDGRPFSKMKQIF